MKLKDWYNRALLEKMALQFSRQHASFSSSRFLEIAGDGLERLEMMDRVRQIASAMARTFPGPTATNMKMLVASMGPLPQGEQEGGMVGSGYHLWPYGEYIGATGLDDWQASWAAMEELTQRLTSEFAIRPFLAADLPASLRLLEARLAHPSPHVRRWISEGTRTRLPWARAVPALKKQLEWRLRLLDALKSDESLYVRRSVANHLQDILKDDLETGLVVLQRWARLGDLRVDWVVKHAARGLLKAGHPAVMTLFGLDSIVSLDGFSVSPQQVALGEKVSLRARVSYSGEGKAAIRLDYRLQGPTPSGGRFGKVFRWRDLQLDSSAPLEVEGAFAFVERSTRRLPAGEYSFTVLANGRPTGEVCVQLGR